MLNDARVASLDRHLAFVVTVRPSCISASNILCIVYITCKCISDLQSIQRCYVIHRVYEKRADYDQHDQSACLIRSKLICSEKKV